MRQPVGCLFYSQRETLPLSAGEDVEIVKRDANYFLTNQIFCDLSFIMNDNVLRPGLSLYAVTPFRLRMTP